MKVKAKVAVVALRDLADSFNLACAEAKQVQIDDFVISTQSICAGLCDADAITI